MPGAADADGCINTTRGNCFSSLLSFLQLHWQPKNLCLVLMSTYIYLTIITFFFLIAAWQLASYNPYLLSNIIDLKVYLLVYLSFTQQQIIITRHLSLWDEVKHNLSHISSLKSFKNRDIFKSKIYTRYETRKFYMSYLDGLIWWKDSHVSSNIFILFKQDIQVFSRWCPY